MIGLRDGDGCIGGDDIDDDDGGCIAIGGDDDDTDIGGDDDDLPKVAVALMDSAVSLLDIQLKISVIMITMIFILCPTESDSDFYFDPDL